MDEYYLSELKRAQFIFEAVMQYAKIQLDTAQNSTEWAERMELCAEAVKSCVREVVYCQKLTNKEEEGGEQDG